MPTEPRQDTPPAVAAAAGEPPEAFPWPPPPGLPLLDALALTWKLATFAPARFFAAMPAHGGYGAALLYYVGIGIAAAGADLFWHSIGPPFAPAEPLRGLGLPAAASAPIVAFLFAPLTLLATILLAAGAAHIALVVLGGARSPFPVTARVFAFAYSPQLFTVVPLLGRLVAFPWMVVLAIVGLSRAHRTDAWRAALAVLLPLALVTLLFAMILLAWLGRPVVS